MNSGCHLPSLFGHLLVLILLPVPSHDEGALSGCEVSQTRSDLGAILAATQETYQNGADEVGKHGHEGEGQHGPPLGASSIPNVSGPIDDDGRPPPPSTPVIAPVVPVPRRAACAPAGSLKSNVSWGSWRDADHTHTVISRQKAISHMIQRMKSPGNARNA
jgi:hypothetical protein